tara:strand:+ start:600 stop:3032 length:2433 start_codon:yes stop_codon:yes gene_type:complete
MAISASSIASSATLNQLRTQFNNLVTDVTAIEGGSISYTTLNTTTTNATTLNVKEDGTIIFEGATDDGFETTLTVVDPTADRTITFPNETGTVHTTGGDTTHTNIIIADGGNIGSASDTNAIGISSGGVVSVTATTANTSATDGALTVAGGLGVAADASIGDDLRLISDSAVLSFGADSDTTLTHTDGTGLTLNSTNKLTFGDAASFVQQSSDGVLRIDGEATIDMNASTAVTVSNDLKLDSDAAVLGFGADNDVTLTHVADTGILLNSTSVIQFNDASQSIGAPNATTLDINATDEVELNATLVDVNANLDVSGTYTGGGLMTTGGNIVIPDAGTIGSASDTDAIAIGSDGDVTLTQDLELQHDGASIAFGTNDEITLTHVHDTGLLLEDSGGTPTLQLHDANESIASDGSKVIITSGGTAFSLPTADGSAGQVLKTNGSAVLSFTDVTASALAADDLTAGDAAVTLTTSSGNITIDAAADDSDIILKGTDGGADTTFLTIDGSDAGTAIFNHDIKIADDGQIGSASAADAMIISSGGIVTFKDDLVIKDGGTIGAASATDAITISSGGVVTLVDDLVIKDGGTIGVASDADSITIASNGAVTLTQALSGTSADFDSGVTIDNITIDGTEIDLSSGDLTLDVAGDIVLDAAGEEVIYKDGSTNVGHVSMDSDNLTIKSLVSDKDMIFQGNDGGTGITALTLDMSEAGAATFNNDVTAFSDERLKTEIETINDALNKVCQMRGVSFKRTDNDGRTSVGVIAQEIEKILPEVVREDKSEDKIKSVAYGNIVGVLIEAIKELKNEIEELKKE